MTLGSHQATIGKSQVHITPRHIIEALGPFDLDPAAASKAPWDCARENFTLANGYSGLVEPWYGLVWLNPPFDRRQILEWITRMVQHNNGIALLHARTETAWFQPVWCHAMAILFLRHRVIFHKPDGSPCTTRAGLVANSGAPVCLVAFGQAAFNRLNDCQLEGALVHKWRMRVLDNPNRSD